MSTGTTMIFNEVMQNNLNKDRTIDRLTEILKETNVYNASIIAKRFLEQVYNKLSKISKTNSFITKLVKGTAYNEIDVDNFFTKNNIILTKSQKEEINHIIQLIFVNELNNNVYQYFEYITQNFPLMSFLKKELLERRPGTNVLQWEFINDKCHCNIKSDFLKISNYKQISDRLCAKAISNLVKEMTNKRFDQIFAQKGRGFFPDGYDNLPLRLHNMKLYHVFLIAYSLKLSDLKYKEMLYANESEYDCLCFEENMCRFAVVKGWNNTEIMKIINENKGSFTESKEYNSEFVAKKIDYFLNKYEGNTDSIIDEFLKLMKSLGVVSDKERKEILKAQRCSIAKKSMKKLIDNVVFDNIMEYFILYKNDNSANDIIDFKYKNDDKRAELAKNVIFENFSNFYNREIQGKKAVILSRLCDRCSSESSGYVNPLIRPILKSKFTTHRINSILNGTIEITRSDILKIGYLYTLINFINQKGKFKNAKSMKEAARELIKEFEDITNKMLKECCFAPVKRTLVLDGTIEMALSNGIYDKCIPKIFQACLPININEIK